jgi:hypothetical protein
MQKHIAGRGSFDLDGLFLFIVRKSGPLGFLDIP